MKLTYLGTGAAEGVPGIYCKCGICQNAREKGGREIRTRSQALLEGDLLIDYPADTYLHSLTYDMNLPEITQLIITHSHSDHFYPEELEMRMEWFAEPVPPLLHIYGNEMVERRMKQELPNTERVMKTMEFHRAHPFTAIEAGNYQVTPLPALHDKKEECLIYAIRRDGKALLYGNDTGIFPEATWEWLGKSGLRFDLVSLDCTTMMHKEGSNHMGLADCVEVKSRLLEIGAADEKTTFVVNHFSHNGDWTHEQMTANAEKEDFLASYDGMTVEF